MGLPDPETWRVTASSAGAGLPGLGCALEKKTSTVKGAGVEDAVADGTGEPVAVGDGAGVAVKVLVAAGLGVSVAVACGVNVGGSPVKAKLPEAFHSVPTKICTSYAPASHSTASRAQFATPTPGGELVQEDASTYLRSPF